MFACVFVFFFFSYPEYAVVKQTAVLVFVVIRKTIAAQVLVTSCSLSLSQVSVKKLEMSLLLALHKSTDL